MQADHKHRTDLEWIQNRRKMCRDIERNMNGLKIENERIMNKNGTERVVPSNGQEMGSLGVHIVPCDETPVQGDRELGAIVVDVDVMIIQCKILNTVFQMLNAIQIEATSECCENAEHC